MLCCRYPFDTVKSIIQTAPDSTPREQLRMTRVFEVRLLVLVLCFARTNLSHVPFARVVQRCYRENGARFFFRGLGTTLLRAVPVNGVTFLVYEKVLSVL